MNVLSCVSWFLDDDMRCGWDDVILITTSQPHLISSSRKMWWWCTDILTVVFSWINSSEMRRQCSDSNFFPELCYCKIRKGFASEEVSFRVSWFNALILTQFVCFWVIRENKVVPGSNHAGGCIIMYVMVFWFNQLDKGK